MRPEQVLEHLARRLPDFVPAAAPVALEGGLLNHTWRVPGHPRPLIVKHAPDHIATAPEVPLDPSRLVFEARALADLAPGGRLATVGDEHARPPRRFDFDEMASVLIMEDLGELPDLSSALAEGRDAQSLCVKVGSFVGRLHGATYERPAIAKDYRNLPIQETRLAVQYRPVAGWLRAEGLEEDRAREIGARIEAFGERLLRPGCCLLMGDLWPPSILVDGQSVRIIDWEFAHFGNPAQDLAHLAAHFAMHALVRRDREWITCWQVLAGAYRDSCGNTARWLGMSGAREDLATHYAAEIFARTLGPFSSSYLLAAGGGDEDPRRAAIERALQILEGAAPSLEDLVCRKLLQE